MLLPEDGIVLRRRQVGRRERPQPPPAFCVTVRSPLPPIRAQTCAATRTSGLETLNDQGDHHNPGAQHQEGHYDMVPLCEARQRDSPLRVSPLLHRNHVENVVAFLMRPLSSEQASEQRRTYSTQPPPRTVEAYYRSSLNVGVLAAPAPHRARTRSEPGGDAANCDRARGGAAMIDVALAQ